ncbi:hypothetical protein JI735_19725 [Paenibacillus sonchi]|uniref:Uncharacterized protein n=1 Tax=Paenibacillus sonchi TaxID=373687 RepID=A0A974SB58_9BACL|nr:hypothetical protein [Paenibacillus sonchi]QQZ58959.1 hypothetical protein JI735_19725 [Paenibacillus sonchi]
MEKWMIVSCPIPHRIERAFAAYMLGGMTRTEYCQRVGYLLNIRGGNGE